MDKSYNFIIARLGDSDFSPELCDALNELMNQRSVNFFCPLAAKRFIVEHVVSNKIRKALLKWSIKDSEVEKERAKLTSYLSQNLRVTFDNKLPSYDVEGTQPIDDDWGSAYYDVNLGKIFYF